VITLSKESRISARIDENIKNEADEIFSRMGLSTSSAISLFLHQVVREQGLPFRPHLAPNEATRKAMKRSRDGETDVYEDKDDMFEELGM
jgi:mRNA interferase YafQ